MQLDFINLDDKITVPVSNKIQKIHWRLVMKNLTNITLVYFSSFFINAYWTTEPQ